MSEESLNASIMAKLESAGLDVTNDDAQVAIEPDVAPLSEDGDTDTPIEETEATGDESEAVEVAAEGDTTETTEEVDPPIIGEPTKEEPAKADEQKNAEDELALALGLGKPPEDPKKRAQWWKQRVPYSQIHKAVVEREKKLNETHTGALKEHTDRISEYDKRFTDVKTVEDIIEQKPEQYIRTLAALYPDVYGKMFAPILGSDGAVKAALPEITDPGPKPEADLELKDAQGQVTGMTYSVKGYQALMDWQQAVTEQNMLKRFKPHLDFVESQQKAAEKQQRENAVKETQQRGLEAAEKALAEVDTWGVTKDEKQAILVAAAKLDPTHTPREALNIAYRMIIVPKLKANRDEMHADIVKGLKKTSAKQTAVGLTQMRTVTPAAAAPEGDVDTRILAAWRKAGLLA